VSASAHARTHARTDIEFLTRRTEGQYIAVYQYVLNDKHNLRNKHVNIEPNPKRPNDKLSICLLNTAVQISDAIEDNEW